MAERKQWEYKFEDIAQGQLERVMNEWGSEGWELIHFDTFRGRMVSHYVVLKREKGKEKRKRSPKLIPVIPLKVDRLLV